MQIQSKDPPISFRDEGWKFYRLIFYALLGALFLIRVFNLNYNSPFSDEAIYIVIGKLGIFRWNWWTYNANSWMAGNQLIYPSLSALSYSLGGIVGSRLLSALFGVLSVEMVFRIAFLITEGGVKQKITSGVISSLLLGLSSISIYVSRLATYDVPSFYFLLLGIYLSLYATSKEVNKGKLYLFSAFFLLLSFATKIITGLFIPSIAFISFFLAKSSSQTLFYWKRYFLPPLLIGFFIYLLINFSSLSTFFNLQTVRERADYISILQMFIKLTLPLLPIYALGSIGLLINRKWKLLTSLAILSFLVVLFHLSTHRLSTFDKHTFLSITFLSLTGGIGISYFLNSLSNIPYKFSLLFSLPLFLILVLYSIISLRTAQDYNSLWANGDRMLTKLNQITNPGDKILTEYGAATILSVYDKDFPTNIHTFDFFQYDNLVNDQAYVRAVRDGYFDTIELDNEDIPKGGTNERIHSLVLDNLAINYKQVYTDSDFTIYKRIY